MWYVGFNYGLQEVERRRREDLEFNEYVRGSGERERDEGRRGAWRCDMGEVFSSAEQRAVKV